MSNWLCDGCGQQQHLGPCVATPPPEVKWTKAFDPLPEPNDITATLNERGARYGKFTGHARITQSLKTLMQSYDKGEGVPSWTYLAPDHQEALEMIAHKIGRILNGDPNYADSWIDIAGYAKLVADRLEGVER